jgi:hypothetical protein
MGRFPLDRELQPNDVLLRNVDDGTVLGTIIGNDDHIVLGEHALLQQILYPVSAVGLLVGDQGQTQGHAVELLREEQAGCEQCGYHGLPVVLRPPAVDLAVLEDGLERRGIPESRIAGRDHIDVGHEPERPLSFPLLLGDDAGPHDRRVRPVRYFETLDIVETCGLRHEIIRLPGFPVAPVYGRQSGYRDHLHHGLDYLRFAGLDLGKEGLQGLHEQMMNDLDFTTIGCSSKVGMSLTDIAPIFALGG